MREMHRYMKIWPCHTWTFATPVFLIATVLFVAIPLPVKATRLAYADLGSGGNACCLVPDASGNYYVIGSVARRSGDTDVSITKLDSGGHVLSSFSFGGGAIDFVSAAAMDSAGNLIIVGDTTSSDFHL